LPIPDCRDFLDIRIPNLLSKNSTEPGDSKAGDLDHATVKIAFLK